MNSRVRETENTRTGQNAPDIPQFERVRDGEDEEKLR